MTLAFKWSHRYEGEGSLEYDQFIELFKCSLIFLFGCVTPQGLSGGSLIRLRVGAEAAMSAFTGPELLHRAGRFPSPCLGGAML